MVQPRYVRRASPLRGIDPPIDDAASVTAHHFTRVQHAGATRACTLISDPLDAQRRRHQSFISMSSDGDACCVSLGVTSAGRD